MLEFDEQHRRKISTLRIIGIALTLGVITWGVIALNVPARTALPQQALSWMRLVCVGLSVAAVMLPLLLRQATMGAARKLVATGKKDRLIDLFGTQAIISMAVAEAPALLAGVIVLLSGQSSDFLLIAIPLFMLLINIPSRSRWESFKERAQRPG